MRITIDGRAVEISALVLAVQERRRPMKQEQIKETLEKQLQLLSERSQECADDHELVELTEAMIKVVSALRPSA